MIRDLSVLTVCSIWWTMMIITEGTVVPTAWSRVYNAVWCCHIAQHENCTVQADHTVWATETSKPSETANGRDTLNCKKSSTAGYFHFQSCQSVSYLLWLPVLLLHQHLVSMDFSLSRLGKHFCFPVEYGKLSAVHQSTSSKSNGLAPSSSYDSSSPPVRNWGQRRAPCQIHRIVSSTAASRRPVQVTIESTH